MRGILLTPPSSCGRYKMSFVLQLVVFLQLFWNKIFFLITLNKKQDKMNLNKNINFINTTLH